MASFPREVKIVKKKTVPLTSPRVEGFLQSFRQTAVHLWPRPALNPEIISTAAGRGSKPVTSQARSRAWSQVQEPGGALWRAPARAGPSLPPGLLGVVV